DLVRPIPVEARPREVDVAVAAAAGAVGLDRRLVVEDAEQVRRRRAVRDDGRAVVLETVLRRVGRVGTAGVAEARDEHVAERLRGSGRITRALGAEERATVRVPGDDRVTRARRS